MEIRKMNSYDSQNSSVEQRQTARQVKTAFMVGVIAFGVTLAVVIGNRLSDLAASILVGAMAGIAASVPMTFFLLLLFGARARPAADEQDSIQVMPAAERPAPIARPYPNQAQPAAQPAFVVVAPPGRYPWANPGEATAADYYPTPMPRLSPPPREFQVIGAADYSGEYEWNGR
jgi:hypothetical protein